MSSTADSNGNQYEFTFDELEALAQLKGRFNAFLECKPYLSDDHFLIQWLRARHLDVEKAEIMLTNHLKVRDAYGMDDPEYVDYIVHPAIGEYYTTGIPGFAKDGCPVVLEALGGVEPKGILSCVSSGRVLRDVMFYAESRRWLCQKQSQKFGRRVNRIIYILDLEGIGSKHLWKTGLDMFGGVAKLVEQHYPESVSKIFVINAPAVFPILYKIVTPILDQRTVDNIKVYGSSGWKQTLLSVIDADQLPVHYGGTATGPDGDPKCSDKIHYGGDVPKELQFSENQFLPGDAVMMSKSIARGAKWTMTVSTTRANAELLYLWRLSSGDLGFSITQQVVADHFDGKFAVIVPYFRLMGHPVAEHDTILLGSPGNYIITFDNSFSRLYSKSLDYFFQVTECDEASGEKLQRTIWTENGPEMASPSR